MIKGQRVRPQGETVVVSGLRHRWEMPLIYLSGILTFGTLFLAMFLNGIGEEALESMIGDSAGPLVEKANTAFLILTMPIFVFVYRFYMAAVAKANAVRVGPNQFPEIWNMYCKLGIALDMNVLPKLYVTNGNGVVNAYALSCNTRNKYVVIHSEIAILMENTPQAVEFVLAHELAHHKLDHVSLWRSFLLFIPNLLIPLGTSTIRAQEYSADRVAHSLCKHSHQEAMNLLSVGPWIHGEINEEAWKEQCAHERSEFFVRIANIFSNHAVLVKRSKALHDIEREGPDAHGDMF